MSVFKIDKNVRSIIIPVGIKGPKNIRFARMILDTGATYTMICPEILVEAGYDLSNPHRKLAITTASSIEYTPFYMLMELKALGKTVSNLEVASHSLPERVPADGLLGLNFLRQFRLTIHINEGFLELV